MNKDKIKEIGITLLIAFLCLFCFKAYHYLSNKKLAEDIVEYSTNDTHKIPEKYQYLVQDIKVEGKTTTEKVESFSNNFIIAFNNTPIENRYEIFINIMHISFCRIAMLNINIDNLEPIEIPTEGMKALYYIQEAMQKENIPFKLVTLYQISKGLKDKYPSLWELKIFLLKNKELKSQFLNDQYNKTLTDIHLDLNMNEISIIKEKIRLAQG